MILGILALAWGVWVASPFWDVFNDSHIYGVMAMFGPEILWGVPMILAGLLIHLGLVLRRVWISELGLLMAFFMYASIAATFLAANWRVTPSVVAVFIAMLYGWCYIQFRLHRDNIYAS